METTLKEKQNFEYALGKFLLEYKKTNELTNQQIAKLLINYCDK